MRRRRVLASDLQSDMAVDIAEAARAGRFALSSIRAFGTVSVVFLPKEEMRRLNTRWFGRKRITDVIAFPLGGPGAPGDDLSGEVFVCPGRALAQAKEAGEDPADEILRLVIHGILHVHGRTDSTEPERREMLAEGEGILRRFLRSRRARPPADRRPAARPAGGRPARKKI